MIISWFIFYSYFHKNENKTADLTQFCICDAVETLCRLLLLLLLLTDGMEVDAAALEAGQFEDADVDHW